MRRGRGRGRWCLGGLAGLALAASVLASCSGGQPAAALGTPGPFAVGVSTLDLGSAGSLGERLATVFYPADAAKLTGHGAYSYDEAEPLPAALRAIVPAKYDVRTTLPARVAPPGSPRGPFPTVLFSHGFGASRLYYAHLLVGMASWGFVVVSADYLERGLVAQAEGGQVDDTPQKDVSVMFDSLSAVEAASADRRSVLAGLVDSSRVAAVGHSAGGETAFDALRDPRITAAVGWAPVGPSGAPADKPTVIIGGLRDIALTPATLRAEFAHFHHPTSLVEVSGAGHDTFTDICPTIRGGGGLVGFAISLHLVSPELAKLAVNGCQRGDLASKPFWSVVQYYTVAALRSAFHLGAAGELGPAPSGRFPGVTVSYRHR